MKLPIDLLQPERIIIAKGSINNLKSESAIYGKNGIIVYGKALKSRIELLASFYKQGLAKFLHTGSEPTTKEVAELISFAREQKADWIAGIGGGSVMDLAKAAAGLFNASESPEYYQAGGKLKEAGIPFIAVPTTAGSGAEATPNAVIIDKAKTLKLSIRDMSWMAKLVILDAELMSGSPVAVVRDSGLDALVQAYESYISKGATKITEEISLSALKKIFVNLSDAFLNQNAKANEELLEGSFLAGVALANARLGVIHGIVHPLGAIYNLPHGALCALSLIPSIRFNREVLGGKYDVLSKTVGGDFEEKISELLKTLNFNSPLAGLKITNVDQIVQETLKSGSTASNPRSVNEKDVHYLLREIFNIDI
ncbi:MAG: iron-containing alcohol dehydrogenase [Fibrobacteres bacterium]|nr:iron-containing alcohol dehydrogenase [Fibrobacterota bacterium]